MDEVFYVVWNPDHGPPRFRHEFEWQAQKEAERLAASNPGQRFYVLRAVSVSENRTVVTTQLREAPIF